MRLSTNLRFIILASLPGILLFNCVFYLTFSRESAVAHNHEVESVHRKQSVRFYSNDYMKERTTGPTQGTEREGLKRTTKDGQTVDVTDTFDESYLNVFVVEEHHEVIPHWFQAANTGTIPKERNILVHIDGHTDTSPILYTSGYPFFKWPSMNELKYLMQRNDGFIQAAAMAGLINRLVWIWPYWDVKNNMNMHYDHYVGSRIHLGWMDVSNETRAQTETAFCMCNEISEGTSCFTFTEIETDFQEEWFYLVHRNRCKILKIITVEEMSEPFALNYFQDFDWNSKNQSIILDIDEDFYGCTYAVDPLIKAKVDLEQAWKVDEEIGGLFCPVNSKQDAQSNDFLVNVLSELTKGDNCEDVLQGSVKCLKYVEEKVNMFEEKLTLLIQHKLVNICQKDYKSENIVRNLIKQFVNFSMEQLQAFIEVGFCLNTSPKVHDIFHRRKFGLCIGANTPNNTSIFVHKPTRAEIESRSTILKGIIKRLKSRVQLVSIARSVRDGYTPREFFDHIERDIIQVVGDTLNENLHVLYDEDLLGGKKGWGSRNRSFVTQFR